VSKPLQAAGNLHVHPSHPGVGHGGESANDDDPQRFQIDSTVLSTKAKFIAYPKFLVQLQPPGDL